MTDCLNSGRESPECDIMDDFYCNGYVTDDTISFEEEKTLKGTSHVEEFYSCNKYFCNDISSQCNCNFSTVNYESYNKGALNLGINNNNVSVLKHYFDPNLWMIQTTAPSQYYNSGVPSQSRKIHTGTVAVTDTATAATAAAAANIAYNSQNIKRSQKRFGGSKLDKFVSNSFIHLFNSEIFVYSHNMLHRE